MSDEWVWVDLVGGPLDGYRHPVQRAIVYEEPRPGVYLLPDRDMEVPEGLPPRARMAYEPDPSFADPLQFLWCGWTR